jgi:hypothetical protein
MADAEKAYIMDRYKMFGVVVNRDADNQNSMPQERLARAFTCTVKDVCFVLDYFSKSGDPLRPYNTCFFVLKKVPIKNGMTWENIITAPNGIMSSKRASATMVSKKVAWQIVPYHVSDNILPVEHRMWEDADGVTHVGGMWRLGRIHEYAPISQASAFAPRVDEHSVARDVSMLHGRGRIKPMQFYLASKTFF